jgi:hypothetical protein
MACRGRELLASEEIFCAHLDNVNRLILSNLEFAEMLLRNPMGEVLEHVLRSAYGDQGRRQSRLSLGSGACHRTSKLKNYADIRNSFWS